MRDVASAPFGVNLPIPFLRNDAMQRFVCDSGVRFVTTAAGGPAKSVAPHKEAGIVVYHALPPHGSTCRWPRRAASPTARA